METVSINFEIRHFQIKSLKQIKLKLENESSHGETKPYVKFRAEQSRADELQDLKVGNEKWPNLTDYFHWEK